MSRRKKKCKATKVLSLSSQQDQDDKQYLEKFKALILEDKELQEFSSLFMDRFLLHFLRGRKYNLEESFNTLKSYIKIRKEKFPEIFKDLQPSNSLKNKNIAKLLKHRDEMGRLVFVSYIRHWDPKETPTDAMIGEISLYVDELMNIEDVEKVGVVQILDLSGFNLRHARTATPIQLHKLISIFHTALPVRLKGTHIINERYLFSVVAKSLVLLLPRKIQERLYFHSSNMASLHEHILPSILPKSLGGILSENEAFIDLSELQRNLLLKEAYYKEFAQKLTSD